MGGKYFHILHNAFSLIIILVCVYLFLHAFLNNILIFVKEKNDISRKK